MVNTSNYPLSLDLPRHHHHYLTLIFPNHPLLKTKIPGRAINIYVNLYDL